MCCFVAIRSLRRAGLRWLMGDAPATRYAESMRFNGVGRALLRDRPAMKRCFRAAPGRPTSRRAVVVSWRQVNGHSTRSDSTADRGISRYGRTASVEASAQGVRLISAERGRTKPAVSGGHSSPRGHEANR
jgi:hypothetical protein